jgi:hypothetical protein
MKPKPKGAKYRNEAEGSRATAQSAADDFFSDDTNLGQMQVEITVEEEEEEAD